MLLYRTVLLLLTSYIYTNAQEAILVQEESVEIKPASQTCFSQESRDNMIKRIKSNSNKQAVALQFRLPLEADSSYKHNGYYSISNFVDHAPNIGEVQDYNCGTRSYDLSTGYNHQGTDFSLWPFSWEIMDENWVHVVASESGTIIQKDDGNPDENCSFYNPLWNAIYIEHPDGSESYYGHLKRGTLTTKQVGESVEKGEHLGFVGSSGQSSGPHLHFEVYNNQGNLIDPFNGDCNQITTSWDDQLNYYDPKALRLDCHSEAPVIGQCKGETARNRQHFFHPADSIYFVSYYRDLSNDLTNMYTMLTPQGNVYFSWDYNSTMEFNHSSYLTWKIPLPANAELGLWGIQLIYNGDTLLDHFEVVDSPASIENQMKTISMNGNTSINTNADKILIYSVNGQLIRTLNNYQKGQNFSLNQGIYLLSIQVDNQYYHRSVKI